MTGLVEKNYAEALFQVICEEQEEKLTPDIYTYKKEEIRRIEKRRENSSKNLFEGVDADTMKEIEELIKD